MESVFYPNPTGNTLTHDGKMKWCVFHKKFEPVEDFGPSSSTPTKLQSYCRQANREYNERRKERAQETAAKNQPATQTTASRRGLNRQTSAELIKVLEKRGYVCVLDSQAPKGSLQAFTDGELISRLREINTEMERRGISQEDGKFYKTVKQEIR